MQLFTLKIIVLLFVCHNLDAIHTVNETPRLITLLTNKMEDQDSLNKLFSIMALRMGFEIETLEVEKSDINDTVHAWIKYENVINLKTKNLCDVKTFEEYSKTNLFIVDNVEVDFIGKMAENDSNPNATTYVVASESILKYNKLFNSIENKDFRIHDSVLLCLPNNTNKDRIVHDIKSQFPLFATHDCHDGMQIDNSVIAVLSPAALELESNTPIIFYNTPQVSDVKTPLNLMHHQPPLHRAFLNFLNLMSWNRVAVLSDDSVSSEVFLTNLLPLFKQKSVVYTDQYCRGRSSNFTDALLLLKKVDARIVILNIDNRHAEKLIQQIESVDMGSLIWIVRDWPFPKDMKFHDEMELFSVTISPIYPSVQRNHMPYVSGIKKSLSVIEMNYKRALGDREEFTRNMNSWPFDDNYNTHAFVTRWNRNKFQVNGYMVMKGEGTDNGPPDVMYFSKISTQLPLDTAACISRAMNYFRPCNDRNILTYISIIIMFTLLLLVIIVYFNKCTQWGYDQLP